MRPAAATSARHPTTTGQPGALDGLLALASLFALGLLAWLLCHPYQGLFHDANLYALQALARLDPEALSNDIFLSHGSQDRFTLFSPLYAAVIAALDLEHAAALLTVVSQAGLCAAAWFLARACLPRWAAAAGVVLLVSLPCEYGPLRIFACLEPFLTPRMAAEALTLAALGTAFRGRGAWTVCLLLLAMLLHPVMALAGIATLTAAGLLRVWSAGHALRAAGIAALLLLSAIGLALLVAGRFDAEWLAIVRARSPYLFLGGWPLDDWIRALTGLLPLAAAAVVFDGPLKRASLSVVLAVLAGWAITGLGADVLGSVFITQLQPWRIEWVGEVGGAVMMPWVITRLWCDTLERRTAALLLIGAVIFRTEIYAIAIGGAALAMMTIRPLNPRHARLVLMGAVGLAGLAVLWRTASDLEFTDLHYLNAALPLWLRRAMSVARDGVLLGALVAVVVWLAVRKQRILLVLVVMLTLAILLLALPFALSDWRADAFPPQRVASFDPWRAQVPPQAQVLWAESPLSTWALLRRPHYLSGLQSSGVVFSRAAAVEIKHRAERLASIINPANFLEWDSIGLSLQLDGSTLSAICRLGVIDYLVSEANLELIPMAVQPPRSGTKRELKLYRCADPR